MTAPPFDFSILNQKFAKTGNKIKPKRVKGPALVNSVKSACHELEQFLNVFSRFPIQHDILSETWSSIPCGVSLPRDDESTPLSFSFHGVGDEFIHPLMMLRFVFQILREDNKKLEEKMITKTDGTTGVEMDKVLPLNFFHNTLWKHVDVRINETAITVQQDTHAFLAYKRLLEEYGEQARNNMMQTALYAMEDSADINAADPTAANATENFKWRAAKIKKSAHCEVFGPLLVNALVSGQHLIPPGSDIGVYLHRNPTTFALMTPESNTTKYKINITEAELYVLRLRPYPERSSKFYRSLDTYGHSVLPLLQQESRTYSAPVGTINFNQLCWDGRLPSVVSVALLDTAAFNGAAEKNALSFGNYGVKAISVDVNGRQIPSTPYQLDFSKGQYARLYMDNLISNYGASHMLRNVATPISYEEYAQNHCFMSFRITPNALERQCRSQAEHGTIRLKIDFASALTKAVTVLVIGDMDRAALIAKNRSVRIVPLEEV